jgi:hypothetical protein
MNAMRSVGSDESPALNRELLIDVTFPGNWNYLPLIKEFVEETLEIYLDGMPGIHMVGTAVSELLENAVKYSMKGDIRATMTNPDGNGRIVIDVCNRADAPHAKELIAIVAAMRESNPLDYYLRRMRESIVDKSRSAGLGLARIYHETRADMTASYGRMDGVVCVNAVISVV